MTFAPLRLPRTGRPASPLGPMARALAVPAFRRIWLGQLVSFVGSWMQAVAQATLVLQLTDSPLALGILTTLQFAPALLLSLVGGVLADRLPKRRLVLITQSVMLGEAVVLALLTTLGQLELVHLYIFAAVLGCATAIDLPARQTLIGELVAPETLPTVATLNHTAFTLAQIVGPLLAGALGGSVGPAACFWLNAASFGALISGVLLIRPHDRIAEEPPKTAVGGMAAQLRAGIGHALRTPEVALVLLLTAVLSTFGYNFTVVLPLVARDVLHAQASSAGMLLAAVGAGSLLAALALAGRERASAGRLLAGAAGFSALLLAAAQMEGWVSTVALLVGVGICSTVFLTTATVCLQAATPPHLRGRVMSLSALVSLGTKPLGRS